MLGRTLPCPDCETELRLIDDAESGIAAVRAEPSGKSARPNGTAGSPSDENAVSPIIERVRAIAGQTSPVWKAVATPVGIGWAVAGTVAVVLLGSLLVGDDDGNLPNANSEQLADSLNEKTTGPNSATPDSAPEIPVRINKEHPAEPIAGIAATPGEAGLEPLNQPGESIPDAPHASVGGQPQVAQTNPEPAVTVVAETPNPGTETPGLNTPSSAGVPTNSPARQANNSATEPTVAPKPATVDPVLAKPKLPVIDVQAALDQPIREYRLSERVALRSVLVELEEMVGVPISIDSRHIEDAVTRLETPIRVSMKSTTVGGILKAALELVQLSFKIEKSGLLIIPEPKAATNE